MAAPLRKSCLKHFIQINNFLGRYTDASSVSSLYVSRNFSVKHEDFFGIEENSNLEEKPSESFADSEAVPHRLSQSEIERLIIPPGQKRSKPKEVIYQAPFGEIRLDSYGKKTVIHNLNHETFIQAITPSRAVNKPFTNDCLKDKTVTKVKKTRNSFPMQEKDRYSFKYSDTSQSGTPTNNTSFPSNHQLGISEPNDQTITKAPYVGAHINLNDNTNKQETVISNIPKTDLENGVKAQSHASNTDARDHPTSSDPPKDSFVDQVYFSPLLHSDQKQASCSSGEPERKSELSKQASCSSGEPERKSDLSYFDQQFFPAVYSNNNDTMDPVNDAKVQKYSGVFNFHDDAKPTWVKSEDECYAQHSTSAPTPKTGLSHKILGQGSFKNEEKDEELNFIDAQYATSGDSHNHSFDTVVQQYNTVKENVQHKSFRKSQDAPIEVVTGRQPIYPQASNRQTAKTNLTVRTPNQKLETIEERHKTLQRKDQPHEDSQIAYDVAMSIRKDIKHKLTDEKKLSAGRMRVVEIKEQIPDFDHLPAADITKILAASIIFENDDFIAIHKPYGLPSHGGPGVRVSVGQLLEPLSRAVDAGRGTFQKLHLIHRLDKETTGIMLLAKSAEVSWQLLGMFRRHEVKKIYWTITKGLPQPHEGVIDVPLARQKINDIYKTVIKPEKRVVGEEIKSHRNDEKSSKAVTTYKVLAHNDNMALVECIPQTGFQHQIRAHLAQVMNSPVLGDHKYSHFDRLAPQKLFPEALQKLNLRQAQVRYLPMHLHAKALVLPEWRGQKNIFIKAKVPKYFLKNLATLKIKIPHN